MPKTVVVPIPWNLQQINLGGVTAGPEAFSDPFASVFENQQHIAYRDLAGGIQDCWYDGHWNLQQITGAGGRNPQGPAAVGGPFVWTVSNQQHFTYRDEQGTIWDAWYDGHWNLQQINGAGGRTPTAPAAVGDPFASVFENQQHIAYRDRTGAIRDSWYDGHSNLQQINLHGGRTPTAPAAAAGPFVWTVSNQQHFTYTDEEGRIWDSWYDGHWNCQQITGAGGRTPTAPAAVGGPFASVYGSQQHIFYRDAKGTIHDSFYDGHYHLQKINAGGLTDGPAAVADPFASVLGDQQQHVGYRDSAGTIFDSFYDGATLQWGLQQINGPGGRTPEASAAVAVGGPFIWAVYGGSPQQHFTYRDREHRIWDSWFFVSL